MPTSKEDISQRTLDFRTEYNVLLIYGRVWFESAVGFLEAKGQTGSGKHFIPCGDKQAGNRFFRNLDHSVDVEFYSTYGAAVESISLTYNIVKVQHCNL